MNSKTVSLITIINKLDLHEKTCYSMKHQKKGFTIVCNQINRKLPDPSNTNDYYICCLMKKNRKSVKGSKTIT